MLSLLALTAVVTLGPIHAEPAPTPSSTTVAPEKLPDDAVLLVIDAFNIVRSLKPEEYAAQRDQVARNLIKNIAPFITPVPPKVTAVPVGKPKPKPKVVLKPKPKLTVKPKPTVTSAVKPTVKPVVKPLVKPTTPAVAEESKVPQKQRIARKFKAAEAPYKALQTSDPDQAAKVGELLRAARGAMATKQFDTAEGEVDAALKLLGCPIPE
jgi:outer membrane biosynthesis protein TonB